MYLSVRTRLVSGA